MTFNDQDKLSDLKTKILQESKNVASFVTIGKTLYDLYYVDKLVKNQKEFLTWTKQNLGFSKSTTYEYIISFRVYNEIIQKLPPNYQPPLYQSHCQLLAKVPDDQLCSVWIKVCERAPNGNITTALLENLLQEMNFKPVKQQQSGQRRKKVQKKDSDSDDDEEQSTQRNSTSQKNNSENNSLIYNDQDEMDEDDTGLLTPEPVLPHLQQMSQFTPPKKRLAIPTTRKKLPFDQEYIYDLAKTITSNNQFDRKCFSAQDFHSIEQHQGWFGSVYCDLSELKPFSKNFKDGIERYLQVIFTRYANKQYDEGLFIIRAEFGSDWFTPILQHPFCILRQRLDWNNGLEFDSFVAFYMGPNEQQFCQYFKNVGFIPGFNVW